MASDALTVEKQIGKALGVELEFNEHGYALGSNVNLAEGRLSKPEHELGRNRIASCMGSRPLADC